jgi:hypothetical protein
MPTVLRLGPFRFFLCSQENREPPHIHVEGDDRSAKYWLEPVQLARSEGFRPNDLTRFRTLVVKHRTEFRKAWRAHFGR